MRYRKIQVEQGSPEWHALRREKFTASRAPALFPETCKLGPITVYREMTEPAKEMAGNSYTAAGHLAEEKAREYCRQNLGLNFAPAVLVSEIETDLMASLDGFVESDGILFENKWTSKADVFAAVESGEIPPDHFVQIQAQFAVSGARLCHYFMVHASGSVVHMEIGPNEEVISEIFKRTKEFMENLRAGIVPERRKPRKKEA
jgi:putative phage-type endonuclease